MGWKEFAFIAVATAVAILLVEPLFDKALLTIAPTAAAKLGVTA